MTVLLGSLAALTSPLLMTIGFVIWDKQWTGSAFALNMFKGSLASIGFLLLSLVTRSSPLSSAVITSSVAGYLIISSIIGILIGDAAWLEALRLLGARRVILVDSLKPFLSAFLGWAILGEELHWAAGIGIVATMVGVTVVSLEKNAAVAEEEEEESDATMKLEDIDIEKAAPPPPPSLLVGYFYAVINVVFDSYASVLTKQHAAALTTWEIGLVRFGSASAMMLITSAALIARDRYNHKAFSETPWYHLPTLPRPIYLRIFLGVLLVTFICSALRNYALFQISLALALTLGSIGPVYAVPIVWAFKGERVTSKAIVFTVVSVAGVAVLCVWGV